VHEAAQVGDGVDEAIVIGLHYISGGSGAQRRVGKASLAPDRNDLLFQAEKYDLIFAGCDVMSPRSLLYARI
jgi:hypothetical protein